MIITLGQQYNVGEKPTVILYTHIINRHAGTSDKNKTETMQYIIKHGTVVIIYCYIIIGCTDKSTTWYLNGFPDGK